MAMILYETKRKCQIKFSKSIHVIKEVHSKLMFKKKVSCKTDELNDL